MGAIADAERPLADAAVLVAVVPLLAAYCVGIGWTFYSGLFRQIGLTPEQVGIDIQYLLVRSAIAIGFLAGVAMLVALIAGGPATLRRRRRGLYLAILLFSVVLSALVAFSSYELITFGHRGASKALVVLVTAVIAVFVFLLFGSFAVAAFDLRPSGSTYELGIFSRQNAGGAVVVFLLAAFPLAWFGGAHYGRQLNQGHEIHNSPWLNIRYVRYIHTASPAFPDGDRLQQTCYFLDIGEHSGVVYLYDPLSKGLIEISLNSALMERVGNQHPPCAAQSPPTPTGHGSPPTTVPAKQPQQPPTTLRHK